MTPSEIIAAVKHSGLPTILVEGVQDKEALRLLDSLTGKTGKVICCSGRETLFAVWERRAELTGKCIAFVADRDLYVIGRIPAEYRGIIFTDGYSLENDMLESKRWVSLQDDDDKEHYERMTALNIDHFWVQIRAFIDKGTPPQWMSPSRLQEDNFALSQNDKQEQDKCRLYRRIAAHPIRYVRGKNMLNAVHHSLCHKGRQNKFSPRQILELCIRPKPKGKMRMLVNRIRSELNS
jgi:hypothetical protein